MVMPRALLLALTLLWSVAAVASPPPLSEFKLEPKSAPRVDPKLQGPGLTPAPTPLPRERATVPTPAPAEPPPPSPTPEARESARTAPAPTRTAPARVPARVAAPSARVAPTGEAPGPAVERAAPPAVFDEAAPGEPTVVERPPVAKPVPVVESVVRPDQRGSVWPLVLFGLAGLIVLLALGLALRRRRAAKPAARRPQPARLPVAAEPEPVAAPVPLPEPPASTPTLQPLALSFHPLEGRTNALGSNLKARVTVTNTGAAPATGLSLDLMMAGAGEVGDAELARFQADGSGQPRLDLPDLAPGEIHSVERTLRVGARDFRPIQLADRAIFVPLVGLDLTATVAGEPVRVTAAHVVGRSAQGRRQDGAVPRRRRPAPLSRARRPPARAGGMTTLIPVLGDQLSLTLPSLQEVNPAHGDGADGRGGGGGDLCAPPQAQDRLPVLRHAPLRRRVARAGLDGGLRGAGGPRQLRQLHRRGRARRRAAPTGRHPRDRTGRVATEGGVRRLGPDKFEAAVTVLEDTRFLCSHARFDEWAEGRRELIMEFFYREMRRETGLLMDGGRPEGGQWNYDKQNRKPPRADMSAPDLPAFAPDAITREVLALVERRFADHPGSLDDFGIAVTRADAERAQEWFLDQRLARFGDWQDAMVTGEPFLYHAVLSFYLNAGLLDPIALCREVEARYRDGRCPLNAAEGFIRQVIGWREYMRGIYWFAGPDYPSRNHLGAHRPLPSFYYDGRTDMACMADAIGNTLAHAYAHHIQRLMITGNFALIAGLDPVAVQAWYLEVYADAYEWVECPNTLGMILYGDGGMLGSKPYAASGNYIDRMSDYCGRCRYDVKKKMGEPDACPFNALYWDFLARNEDELRGNRRLRYPYQTWDRMGDNRKAAIRGGAAAFLDSLEGGG